MKQLIFIFLLLLPVFSFGQLVPSYSSLPPAVAIMAGTVQDSVTKKAVNVSINVSWDDSTKTIPCNARGSLEQGYLFYHMLPESLIITSANPAYHVSKYKVKILESGNVVDGKYSEILS